MPQVMSPADQKYCSECGKLILRRAEICPGCGCRQSSPRGGFSSGGGFNIPRSPELEGPFLIRMALLIGLNVLWSGIGNVAIGDKRGWGFMFMNIIVFIVSIFTAFVPSLLFFAICSYAGYRFLSESRVSAAEESSYSNGPLGLQ